MTGQEPVQISIPSDLAEQIEARLQYTEWDTISEYAEYVLEECISEVNMAESEQMLSEEEVRSRLEDLGYLEG